MTVRRLWLFTGENKMETIIVVKCVLACVVGGLFSFISTRNKSRFGIIVGVIIALIWTVDTGSVVGLQLAFWMFDSDGLCEINEILSTYSRQAWIFYSLWSGQAITFWIWCWLTRNKWFEITGAWTPPCFTLSISAFTTSFLFYFFLFWLLVDRSIIIVQKNESDKPTLYK